MPIVVPDTELRDPKLLRQHYEFERELADRLRRASKQERRDLYSVVYDEYFSKVGESTQNTASRQQMVAIEAQTLAPFLSKNSVFLEIGAGDCALALHVADAVKHAYAIEASAKVAPTALVRDDFGLILSDSILLPFDDNSIDVAYSCHFLEHLHPEDAREHTAEVRRILRPDGVYLCVTPNRLWGPHDISRYFDEMPTGFHLREYTHAELCQLMREAGYASTRICRGVGKQSRFVSPWRCTTVEYLLDLLPPPMRRRVMNAFSGCRQPPLRKLEQVVVLGRK